MNPFIEIGTEIIESVKHIIYIATDGKHGKVCPYISGELKQPVMRAKTGGH